MGLIICKSSIFNPINKHINQIAVWFELLNQHNCVFVFFFFFGNCLALNVIIGRDVETVTCCEVYVEYIGMVEQRIRRECLLASQECCRTMFKHIKWSILRTEVFKRANVEVISENGRNELEIFLAFKNTNPLFRINFPYISCEILPIDKSFVSWL